MNDNTAIVILVLMFLIFMILTLGNPDILDGLIKMANSPCVLN